MQPPNKRDNASRSGDKPGANATRRQVLQSGAAAAALTATGTFAVAGEKKYADQSLDFLVIQPHAVAGRKIAEDFEQATGAKVNVTAIPYDQIQAKATLDSQSGANQYDVIDFFYTGLGQFVEDGVIADVTDWINRDQAEIQPSDFIIRIYDTHTLYKGRRFGLPFDGNSHLLFYNKEILDRNGVKPPATWAEYNAVAKTVTQAESRNGIYGAAVLGAKIPAIIISTYANRLAGFGGEFVKSDGTSALDSEAAVQAAQSLVDSAPWALPTPIETRFEEGLPAFLSGKVALIEFWSDLGIFAQDTKGSKIVDKWGVTRIPVGGSNTTPRLAYNAGLVAGIAKASAKKELAWELIKFATSKNYHEQLLILPASGIDPFRTSGLYSEKYKSFAPKVQAALAGAHEHALAWPAVPGAPKLEQRLSDELALVLTNKKKPEDAIKDAHKAWNTILSS